MAQLLVIRSAEGLLRDSADTGREPGEGPWHGRVEGWRGILDPTSHLVTTTTYGDFGDSHVDGFGNSHVWRSVGWGTSSEDGCQAVPRVAIDGGGHAMTVVPLPRPDRTVDFRQVIAGVAAHEVWGVAGRAGLVAVRLLVHVLSVLLRLVSVAVLVGASALSFVVLVASSVGITLGLFVIFGHVW